MTARVMIGVTREGWVDRMAIAISGLCLVHCIGSAVLLAVLASASSFILNPIFHEVGIVVAVLLGVLGLGRGMVTHGFMLPSAIGGLGLGMMAGSLMIPHGEGEIIYSMIGVLLLALGHDLNRRAVN